MRLGRIATPADKSQRIRGFIAITLSAALYGLLGIFGKAAFARGLSPGEFLSLRFVASALMLNSYVLMTKPRSLIMPRTQLAKLVLLGLFGNALFCTLYFEALKRLPASLTVLIFYSNPVVIALGSWLCFGQRLSRRTLTALPLVTVGIVLLVLQNSNGGSVNSEGLFLCLATALTYSAYVLIASRWLTGISSVVSTCYILTVGALALTLTYLRSPRRALEVLSQGWDVILGVSTLSTVVPMILLFWGLRRLRPAEVGLLSTVEPVAGVILAMVILGETLTTTQIVGGMVVIGSLIFMALEAGPRPAKGSVTAD